MRALSILTLCALTLINVANGQTGSSGQPPDVYLITIDTLRADHVHSYGDKDIQTPALDDLARHGIRFAQAFTPTPITNSSHASILTGLLPSGHGVTDFARPLVPRVRLGQNFLKKAAIRRRHLSGQSSLTAKRWRRDWIAGSIFTIISQNARRRSHAGDASSAAGRKWCAGRKLGRTRIPRVLTLSGSICMIRTIRMSLLRLIPRSTKTDCMTAKLPLPTPRWQILSAISSSVAGTTTR